MIMGRKIDKQRLHRLVTEHTKSGNMQFIVRQRFPVFGNIVVVVPFDRFCICHAILL